MKQFITLIMFSGCAAASDSSAARLCSAFLICFVPLLRIRSASPVVRSVLEVKDAAGVEVQMCEYANLRRYIWSHESSTATNNLSIWGKLIFSGRQD